MAHEAWQLKLEALGIQARAAARKLALMSAVQKNRCLELMASEIAKHQEQILAANVEDVRQAQAAGLSPHLLDRLLLTPADLERAAKSLRSLVGLPDPLGKVQSTWLRPNGLEIRRIRVPIGVIAVIYESRPCVTVDAAGVCLKSGNAAILRGGSEALGSNLALVKAMLDAARKSDFPEGALQLVPWPEQEAVDCLLKQDATIDLVIPRGSESLVRHVVETSTIPVIKHGKGVCHVYVHKDANLEMALKIVENSKCQRPRVGNAVETVLINADICAEFAPKLAARLRSNGVEVRGDEQFRHVVQDAAPAAESDWGQEYLDLIIAVRVVKNLDEAVAHIARYGTGHSDCIVTQSKDVAARFTEEVDSAAVYVNASTQFTDGSQFGMGSDIGISTGKIHARGPVGVEELTTYKYVITGDGQIRK